MIVVGAASKGIIQRDHQHNAVVFKQTYASNPFSGVSEDDVEKYKQEVNQGPAPAAGAQLIGIRLSFIVNLNCTNYEFSYSLFCPYLKQVLIATASVDRTTRISY